MKIIKVLSCLDCPYFLCSEGGDQYCDYLEKDLEDYDLDDINIVPDCPLEDYVESKSCDGCKREQIKAGIPCENCIRCYQLFRDNYEPKKENEK